MQAPSQSAFEAITAAEEVVEETDAATRDIIRFRSLYVNRCGTFALKPHAEILELIDNATSNHSEITAIKVVGYTLALGPSGLSALMGSLQSSHSGQTLKRLEVAGNRIGNAGIKSVASFLRSKNCQLSHLDVSDSEIGASGATALAESLVFQTTIETLLLSNNSIGHRAGTALISSLASCIECRHVEMASMNLGPGTWEVLGATLAKNSKIQDVNLSHNRIGDRGIEALANALRNHRGMQSLRVAGTGLSHHGGCALRSLLEVNSCITHLDLAFNTIGSGVTKAIQQHLTTNALNHLQKSGSQEGRNTENHNQRLDQLNEQPHVLVVTDRPEVQVPATPSGPSVASPASSSPALQSYSNLPHHPELSSQASTASLSPSVQGALQLPMHVDAVRSFVLAVKASKRLVERADAYLSAGQATSPALNDKSIRNLVEKAVAAVDAIHRRSHDLERRVEDQDAEMGELRLQIASLQSVSSEKDDLIKAMDEQCAHASQSIAELRKDAHRVSILETEANRLRQDNAQLAVAAENARRAANEATSTAMQAAAEMYRPEGLSQTPPPRKLAPPSPLEIETLSGALVAEEEKRRADRMHYETSEAALKAQLDAALAREKTARTELMAMHATFGSRSAERENYTQSVANRSAMLEGELLRSNEELRRATDAIARSGTGRL